MKNYRVMAVDPGTINTGVVIGELGPDDTVQMVAAKKVNKRKGDAWRRVTTITAEIVDMIEEYDVRELWVELYIPYGRRRGSLWNMMLVGALLYLPVTRSKDNLISYGLYAREWKPWLKKMTPDCDADKRRAITFAKNQGIEFTDEMEEALTDVHVADALGLILFPHFAGDTNEHPTCDPKV